MNVVVPVPTKEVLKDRQEKNERRQRSKSWCKEEKVRVLLLNAAL